VRGCGLDAIELYLSDLVLVRTYRLIADQRYSTYSAPMAMAVR
jgi:hypothetical protein